MAYCDSFVSAFLFRRRLLVTRSFHQAALRDQRRQKPRARRPKSNVFVNTDVSAQETTTPVPYSSDTHEEVESSAGGESPECTTYNDHPLYMNIDSEDLNRVDSPGRMANSRESELSQTNQIISQYAVLNPISIDEVAPNHHPHEQLPDQEESSAITSDTDFQSKAAGKRKKKQWKPNSDVSTTGPVSSETSDIDTSANEQTSGGKTKKRFSTLFSGLAFGRSKDKVKDKDKSKDKTKEKKSKSKHLSPSPGPLMKTGSEPQLNEAEEVEVVPPRGAITPDPAKSRKIVHSDQEPEKVQPVKTEVDVNADDPPSKGVSENSSSNHSSANSTPNRKRFQTIQERINNLQRQAGIVTESDSDSQPEREVNLRRRASNSGNASGGELTCTSPTGRPVQRSNRILQAIELFEGHSTHSSGETPPRKSSQPALEGKTDHTGRKSSTSPVSSNSASQLPSQSETGGQKSLSIVEEASPDPPNQPDLEISVVEGSGSEDLQPPAIPLKRTKSPIESSSVLEDMKLFAKFQASTSRNKLSQPPAVPPPYRQSRKSAKSGESSPKMSEMRKSPEKTEEVSANLTSSDIVSTSPVNSKEADEKSNDEASPSKNSASLKGLSRSESFASTLTRSEPNLLDSPSSPPVAPVRQQSKDVERVSSRTLPRRTPTHTLQRAASVDSCLDESHKSTSPQPREEREPSSDSNNLPTLGDDLSSFLDKAFSSPTGFPSSSPPEEKDQQDGDENLYETVKDPGMANGVFTRSRVTKSARHNKRHSIGNVLDEHVPEERRKVHRTPSMDALNDRTERLSRHFFASSSSEDEDEEQEVNVKAIPPRELCVCFVLIVCFCIHIECKALITLYST